MSAHHFATARGLAEAILRNSAAFRWELQGFGMLRCYLPGDLRLQVWDNTYAVPGVTTIHDHPWNFESLIVAGELLNERFGEVDPTDQEGGPSATHMCRNIIPGVGLRRAGDGEDQPAYLVSYGTERYTAGMVYEQRYYELHESRPSRGTVTLIGRQRVGADVARSYYPYGAEWVSAEPRLATEEERTEIIGHALQRWFTPLEVQS